MRYFQPRIAPLLSLSSGKRANSYLTVLGFGFDANRVAERASESLVTNIHPITILQNDAIAKTQRMSAEEMHVHIAGLTVSFKFEVMMLEVGETMTHVFFACLNQF